jgi:hypothetical protein
LKDSVNENAFSVRYEYSTRTVQQQYSTVVSGSGAQENTTRVLIGQREITAPLVVGGGYLNCADNADSYVKAFPVL